MKPFTSSVVESDFFHLFLHLPTRLFLVLFSIGLCLQSTISEYSLYLVALTTAFGILVHLLTRTPIGRTPLIGGDIFVVAFGGITLYGLSSDGFQIADLQAVKIFIYIYVLVFALELFPTLNERFTSVLIGSFFAIALAMTLTIFRMPFLAELIPPAVPSPFPGFIPFVFSGLTTHAEEFGFLLALLVSFPLSFLLVNRRLPGAVRGSCAFLIVLMAISCLVTFQETSWLIFAIPFATAFFVLKKTPSLVLTIVVIGTYYILAPKILPEKVQNHFKVQAPLQADERRILLRANLRIFNSSPWQGVGYDRNLVLLPNHFEDKGIAVPIVPAPNTYFQLLATTGVFGFIAFMGFAISLLFLSLRLLQDIPKTHHFHRSFVVASLGTQLAFHSAGLFTWTLGSKTMIFPFVFAAATISFLGSRYSRGVVPDDYSI